MYVATQQFLLAAIENVLNVGVQDKLEKWLIFSEVSSNVIMINCAIEYGSL